MPPGIPRRRSLAQGMAASGRKTRTERAFWDETGEPRNFAQWAVTSVSYSHQPRESARYRDFMGWDMPWYSVHASLGELLVGRQIGLFHLVC